MLCCVKRRSTIQGSLIWIAHRPSNQLKQNSKIVSATRVQNFVSISIQETCGLPPSDCIVISPREPQNFWFAHFRRAPPKTLYFPVTTDRGIIVNFWAIFWTGLRLFGMEVLCHLRSSNPLPWNCRTRWVATCLAFAARLSCNPLK